MPPSLFPSEICHILHLISFPRSARECRLYALRTDYPGRIMPKRSRAERGNEGDVRTGTFQTRSQRFAIFSILCNIAPKTKSPKTHRNIFVNLCFPKSLRQFFCFDLPRIYQLRKILCLSFISALPGLPGFTIMNVRVTCAGTAQPKQTDFLPECRKSGRKAVLSPVQCLKGVTDGKRRQFSII